MSKYLSNVFSGKKVLITGHTGFKGTWLTIWLQMLGAEVFGVALDPLEKALYNEVKINLEDRDFRSDIRDQSYMNEVFRKIKPDFLFHLAAQPLVSVAYMNPLETWTTNLIGTVNILDALRNLNSSCIGVLITSDKCYDNQEWVWGYRESDKLGGADPYSASKAGSELAINSYFRSYFSKNESNVQIASARAGNVIGGGDWSVDRIIPDCVRSWHKNESVLLRNPGSTRPWQHVLEPLSGYLSIAAALKMGSIKNGEAFNFGPSELNSRSVLDLVEEAALYWPAVKWRLIASESSIQESQLLKLSCDKSWQHIKWSSTLSFKETVKYTIDWYRGYYENPNDSLKLCCNQILDYQNIAKSKGLQWAT
jgi:CDP-glucose 4,6-dehydratase